MNDEVNNTENEQQVPEEQAVDNAVENQDVNTENPAEDQQSSEPEAAAEEPADGAAEQNPAVEDVPAKETPEELLAQANDRYLRLRAEFDNYRKRMAREALETREAAKCQTIAGIANVYDYFVMAMASAENATDMNAIRQGMQMIFGEFQKSFENLGVKVIDAVGKPFDPKLHAAVAQEASDTVAEGVVLRQWKCGLMLGERLICPASVVVSSGPAKQTEESAPEAK